MANVWVIEEEIRKMRSEEGIGRGLEINVLQEGDVKM
jgi:hypothetical protein